MTNSSHDLENNGHDSNKDHEHNVFDPHADVQVSQFVGLEDIMRALTANPHLRRTFRSRYDELCVLVRERNDGLRVEDRFCVPSLKAFRSEIRRLETVDTGYGLNRARDMVAHRYKSPDELPRLDDVVTETYCIGAAAIAVMLQVPLSALPGDLKKLWFTLSYDKATWCVVQADVKATPLDRNGVADVVDAMMIDKTDRARKLGCISGWEMCGVPQSVYMEPEFAFGGSAKEAVIEQIGVNIHYPPTKYWTGRRFVEKVVMAAFAPDKRRAEFVGSPPIDVDEARRLTEAALTRYIVDSYHATPNAALGGETPCARWQRLKATELVRKARN